MIILKSSEFGTWGKQSQKCDGKFHQWQLMPWFSSCVICTCWAHFPIIMASENPKMCKQGTAGTRKHIMLTISQNLKIIWRCENGEGHVVMSSCNSRSSNYLCYEETEGPVIILYGIKWKWKGLFKRQTLQEHKLVQLDMLLYKWFSSAFWRKPHDWGLW